MAAMASPRIVTGISVLFVFLCFAKALVSVWHILTTSAPDFSFYYHASESLLPPMSVLIYRPLTLLPFRTAEILWILGSVAAFLHTVWLCTRRYGPKTFLGFLVASSAAYLAFPTQFTLGMGQVNFIAIWLLVLSAGYMEQKDAVRSALLIALAILLKPELVFAAIPLGFARAWKLLGTVACIGVFSILVSLGFSGAGHVLGYQEILGSVFRDIPGLAVYYNQGLTGVLARAHVFTLPLYALVSLGIVCATAFGQKSKRRSIADTLWLFMPVLLLIEPIAWQHHFVFLIPAYMLLWAKLRPGVLRWMLAISYGLVGWNFAHPQILATIPFGWLILSHGAIGTAIVWILSFLV